MSRSPAETEVLGEALGRAAFAGAVILLEGPLGAGKTTLVRGLARGLGVSGPVTSPSFTIMTVYPGRLPLHHLDLYRLTAPAELRAFDPDEVFATEGVAVVEWPRWLAESPPGGALGVALAIEGPEERRVTLAPLDPRWEERLAAV